MSLTQWFKEKWVDLSRPKEGGGFEPCGREDARGGKYPKCVPAARAARMTPEQIESAIRRKRMAESREKREGKKPIMVATVEKVGDKPGHPFRGNQHTKANKHAAEVDKALRKLAGDKVADTWKPLVSEAMKVWYGQGDMSAPIKVKGKTMLVGGREINAQNVLDTMADALGDKIITRGSTFGEDSLSKKESKNVPSDPELYARVKAEAKKKFDVYPSAYANGWLVAEYKRRGGKYKVAKYNPNHDEKGRFSSSNRAKTVVSEGGRRTAVGPEGVQILLAKPIGKLKARHGVDMDWEQVSAVDATKREKVAKAYARMKTVDDSPEVKKSWDDAEVEIKRQFKQLTEEDGIKVEFVDQDPYTDFHDMHRQVSETGVLKVLRTESTGGHPYWSNETNDMFRAVHDAYGHLGTGRGFDRHGEEAAYQAHRSMFSESAQMALATELRGQNQFLIANGYFGDQKVGFLPAELQKLYLAIVSKAYKGEAMITADDDNAYKLGNSHHTSGGRHFASARNLKKDSPTPTDVHVPTIMNARKKKRDLQKKRMKMDAALAKKEPLKDPKGGLTAAGRKKFNRETGSKLRPGVRGAADTPIKMRRKGSFLTRFFTNPSGPMVKPNGEPTRLALSAAAWGEPVPKNRSDAAKLAAKGRRLLERYENTK